MKIVVLNGSPKGMNSVTMQYVLFVAKKFPEHELSIHNVCQEVHRLEADSEKFGELIASVAAADAVIWAFPVYCMLVHAYYKRFIDLLFERQGEAAFRGKYATLLSTSIHFFDHTAHAYVEGICEDLGMKCVRGYSAEMYDLLDERERDRLTLFAQGFFAIVDQRAAVARRHQPIRHTEYAYEPGELVTTVGTRAKTVVIVTDAVEPHGNLGKMVERLRRTFQGPVWVVNLHDIEIRGGCMGCIQCGLDNECVYKEGDDIYDVYQRLEAADVLVFAGTIEHRYLSSRWKLFFDRGFFNNHVPVFTGKQIGYVLSGPLGQLANLRQILEAYALCERANLAGIATDECRDSAELDRELDEFARQLVAQAATGYVEPPNFLAVGGGKIFRDEIWSSLRLVFKADHRYYRSHGLYNFPTRSLKTRLSDGIMSLLLTIPGYRREFRKRIKDEMVKPLAKVLEGL